MTSIIKQKDSPQEFRKGYKYRLVPTPQQKELFFLHARAYRFVYNWGLGQIKAIMDTKSEDNPRPKLPTSFDLSKQLTHFKKLPENSFLAGVNAQTLQAALKDLDFAMKNFFRRIKKKEVPGFPRFKSRDRFDGFRYPQISHRNISSHLRLPNIGSVAYIEDRPFKGTPKTMTIVRDGKNWFASISTILVRPRVIYPQDPQATLELVVLENKISFKLSSHDIHELIQTPTPYFDELKRLGNLNKSLARKVKGSANRKDCIQRMNIINMVIRDRRKDFLHKLSHEIVTQYNTIIVNKLPIKEMMDDEHLALALSDCGWNQFVTMIKYKCDWHQKYFLEQE